jgi:transposase-like protein
MALLATSRRISVRRNFCAVTLKDQVTDRAKRYRANQLGCLPAGKKACALCGSIRFLTVDHKDGDESNGAKSNLRWLCKSCNTKLGARDAREGRGRRTAQFNPKGAVSFEQWSEAISTLAGEGLGTMTVEQARQIVHNTSKRKRSEFNEDVWRIRKERYGPSGRKDGGAGGAFSDEVPF